MRKIFLKYGQKWFYFIISWFHFVFVFLTLYAHSTHYIQTISHYDSNSSMCLKHLTFITGYFGQGFTQFFFCFVKKCLFYTFFDGDNSNFIDKKNTFFKILMSSRFIIINVSLDCCSYGGSFVTFFRQIETKLSLNQLKIAKNRPKKPI